MRCLYRLTQTSLNTIGKNHEAHEDHKEQLCKDDFKILRELGGLRGAKCYTIKSKEIYFNIPNKKRRIQWR